MWVISHRGASHAAPEHTWAAYDLAVSDGADFLEADLQMTSDGVLVCLHDSVLDRTSDGAGPVRSHTLAELRRLDFGSWFNHSHPDRARADYAGLGIVTFEEQLSRYLPAYPGLRFHVELKHESAASIGAAERELARILDRHNLLGDRGVSGRIVLQNFWLASLALMNDLTGDRIETALLVLGPGPPSLPEGIDIVAPNHLALLADPGYVGRLHDQGIEIHTWTVDGRETMRQLIEIGVDGIFTNRPKVLHDLLAVEFPDLGHV